MSDNTLLQTTTPAPLSQLSFLIADDEAPLAEVLRKLIANIFPGASIHVANNGSEAWDVIQFHAPNIIISDLRMPGITGIELCKKVRSDERLRGTYFLVITAVTDAEHRLEAFENQVDDYLTKPINGDELIVKLRAASRIVRLQQELTDDNARLQILNTQLRQDLEDTVSVATAFMSMRAPDMKRIIENVVRASQFMAENFGDFSKAEIETINLSARLAMSGRMCLPDKYLLQPVMMNGKLTENIMAQVPLLAEAIFKPSKRFTKVRNILRHIYENYDGSGIPDRLKISEIPLESRLLRVPIDYEIMLAQPNAPQPLDVFQAIKRDVKHVYDSRFVQLFEQFIWQNASAIERSRYRVVQVYDLQSGMTVAQDLVTNSGLKLLPAGTQLTDKIIERVLSHSTLDPIIGLIYVMR